MTKLGNSKVAHVRVESLQDDRTYEGDFTIKRQGLMDYSRQQLRKLELNGGRHYVADDPGAGVPSGMEYFNEMISTLEVAITKAPDWWNLEDISDFDVLQAVYKEVTDFESTFLNRGRDKDSGTESGVGDSTADSGAQRREPNGTEGSGAVVVQEVSPALQP